MRWLGAGLAALLVLASAGGLAYNRHALARTSEGDGTPVTAEPVTPAAKPRRIVSLNVCTDQLLMQMVERDRIRAVA